MNDDTGMSQQVNNDKTQMFCRRKEQAKLSQYANYAYKIPNMD